MFIVQGEGHITLRMITGILRSKSLLEKQLQQQQLQVRFGLMGPMGPILVKGITGSLRYTGALK